MTPVSVDALRSGGKRALAAALAAIETEAGSEALADLLDQACRAARGATLGLTGPPGVGKSTLTNSLIAAWRRAGETVGVIAVDPSSRRSGGALLGDRARLATDPSVVASSSGRWPPVTGSAACPTRQWRPWC